MPKTASVFFKQRLRELRRQRGWTQEKAAEKCALPYKMYQFYELGVKENPGLLTIEKICRGFGLELHEFFSPDSPKQRQTKI